MSDNFFANRKAELLGESRVAKIREEHKKNHLYDQNGSNTDYDDKLNIKSQVLFEHLGGGLEVFSDIQDKNGKMYKNMHIIAEDGLIDERYPVLKGADARKRSVEAHSSNQPHSLSNNIIKLDNSSESKQQFKNVINDFKKNEKSFDKPNLKSNVSKIKF